MKGSRSPSRTAWAFPTSRPVLTSDQGVRLQHVVSNLGAELGRHDLATDLVELRRALLLLALEKARLEDLHSHLAVLHLRTLVLARDDDARGQMRDPYGRVGLVDVLAARARGAVGVDAQVLRIDHDRALV